MKYFPRPPFAVFVLSIAIFISAMNPVSPAGGEESAPKPVRLEKMNPDDIYIKGYAEALISGYPQLKDVTVNVENGNVTFVIGESDKEAVRRVETELSKLKIVNRIMPRVRTKADLPPREFPRIEIQEKSGYKTAGKPKRLKPELFKPLTADQRWPHFSFGYQGYIDKKPVKKEKDFLSSAIPANFGETFRLMGPKPIPFFKSIKFDIGIHAAAFALFDMDESAFDLVNTDFWIAIPAVGFRYGKNLLHAFSKSR